MGPCYRGIGKIIPVPARIRAHMHLPGETFHFHDLHNLPQLAILCTFFPSILLLWMKHLPLGILYMFHY
ncbi:hypothetical protein ACN38_g7212 [Penicillium nordicum]|uniref:Uncharacterized protein n=1 Tax=Penicillium nordicum TaxID=229535 RepID=A0A0M8P208_9EURO|nr:hypothetical protein ACN38_g7212 [Penicillium nordicum]